MSNDPRAASTPLRRTLGPFSSASQAALGFGCASLYRLPQKRDRLAALEAAYESGIRHFDVAPIYGLGLAEDELGHFIANGANISVATKFGIKPTTAGRLTGVVQGPIRRALQLSDNQSLDRGSGSERVRRVTERILYSRRDYSVATARRALTASLRRLGVDRIDYFFLHEPAGALTDGCPEVVEYLERERCRGLIGHWGPAGDMSHMDANLASVSGHATAHQFPYDLIGGYGGPRPQPGRTTITFGFISLAFPRVRALLAGKPMFQQECSELLDADLEDQQTVIRLLVRNAVTHNRSGTVLISSTKVGNIKTVCEAAAAPLRNEAEVSSMIGQECRKNGWR
jgi:D-threo-aldose 1-dehydrogenase